MNREVIKQVIADQKEYFPPDIYFNRSKTTTLQRFSKDPISKVR